MSTHPFSHPPVAPEGVKSRLPRAGVDADFFYHKKKLLTHRHLCMGLGSCRDNKELYRIVFYLRSFFILWDLINGPILTCYSSTYRSYTLQRYQNILLQTTRYGADSILKRSIFRKNFRTAADSNYVIRYVKMIPGDAM